jgi:hypothetical protein
METLKILRPSLFLVPSVILIGIGLWSVTMNTTHYFEDMNVINNSKGICGGKHCYCTNPRCVTGDVRTNIYIQDSEWSIGFLIGGGIILVVSRKWWK